MFIRTTELIFSLWTFFVGLWTVSWRQLWRKSCVDERALVIFYITLNIFYVRQLFCGSEWKDKNYPVTLHLHISWIMKWHRRQYISDWLELLNYFLKREVFHHRKYQKLFQKSSHFPIKKLILWHDKWKWKDLFILWNSTT